MRSKKINLTIGVMLMACSFTLTHAQMKSGDTLLKKQETHSVMNHDSDMKSHMGKMQDNMNSVKSTGDVDLDFAFMMKIHHEGAVTMAEDQIKNGKSEQMKKIAKDIIAAQKKEIAIFDKFIQEKNKMKH